MSSPTSTSPDITAYVARTPNGFKVTIALEELGLPYKPHELNLLKGDQKESWYQAISPFGLMPALTDSSVEPDSYDNPLSLFESENILLYLVNRYDSKEHKLSFPAGSREAYEMVNWLFFSSGTFGPKQSNAMQFSIWNPDRDQHAARMFMSELTGCYDILERRLRGSRSGFVVGDHFSVADIAFYVYTTAAGVVGIDVAGRYPYIRKWMDRIEERPSVKKGMERPFSAATAIAPDMKVEEKREFLRKWYDVNYYRRLEEAEKTRQS